LFNCSNIMTGWRPASKPQPPPLPAPYRPALSGFVFFLLICHFPAYGQAASREDQEIRLEVLRTQIRDIKNNINTAREDTGSYLQELQSSEMAIAEASARLESLNDEIRDRAQKLEQLVGESLEQEKILASERSLLAEQVRVAYKTGRHDFLKLLLNQEDPGLIGRMIVFHDYHNKARTDRIREIQITLQNLESLRRKIDNESLALERLRREQSQKLDQLQAYRDTRTAVIQDLERFIATQDRELQNLQQEEHKLAELLDRLGKERTVVELYENLPPFSTLKGKLDWPAKGSIVTRYGSTKKGGKLRWNGVRISAATGEEVIAVSAGKVIFADWFRNLGLLLIIDHGEGFMSLYGHNERLLKKAGDFVDTGEPVARMGNTGGQSETALYFEIREQGNPVNPGLWCRSG